MAQVEAAYVYRVQLHGTSALAAVAMLIGVAFGLSTLITPLYPIYQQQFAFSQITLTLIYAVYAIGNVAALLFFGRASDRAGRRRAALSAIATLIIAVLVFLLANGIAMLYIARVLSGFGIGVASGTGNAWLAELVGQADKARAATIGTSANFLGLGFSALLSGLLAQYAPWPLHLPFMIYFVILCAVALLLAFTQETVRQADPRHLSVHPQLSLPREIRPQFVAPAITGFGLMALVGYYAALMPAMLLHELNITSHAAAGALFFELAMVVAVVIVATQRLVSRTSMMLSLALMIPAAGTVVAAQTSGMLWVLVAATALVGVSTGLGYRGSLQVVNQIAPSDKRAAVLSTYFVFCFIGNALPVIGAGVLSSLTNATVAVMSFACVIAAFAAVALIFALVYRR